MSYQPRRLASGVVVSGGVGLHGRGERRSILRPEEAPFRALVVAQRVVGETGNVRGLSVECDVVLVRTQIAIRNVPVMQRQHGINNVHDLWVPRPATRVVSDPALPLNLSRVYSRRGTFIGPPTPLGDTDGDMVLVDFIEGNQDYPIIIGALPTERTNRVLRAGAGWREGEHDTRGNPRRDEYYVHHYGCELRINEQGELLIDTVGAYSDASTEDASSTSIGQIRMRVKDGQRITFAVGNDEDVVQIYKDSGQLKVDLGKNADQQIPLGNDQLDALKAVLDAIDTFASALAHATPAAPNAALTVASVLAAYNVGPPAGGLAAAIVQAKTDLENALSSVARTKKT